MGQYKVYINLKTMLRVGISYDKGFSLEIDLLCFTVGVGLTESARGFGFWKC